MGYSQSIHFEQGAYLRNAMTSLIALSLDGGPSVQRLIGYWLLLFLDSFPVLFDLLYRLACTVCHLDPLFISLKIYMSNFTKKNNQM